MDGWRANRRLTRYPLIRPFDPFRVKCYKSAFCSCPCALSSGCFAGRIWGILGPARGQVYPDSIGASSLWNEKKFALRSRLTALGRKSVPETTVQGCNCPD
jgi:hypothetical protein